MSRSWDSTVPASGPRKKTAGSVETSGTAPVRRRRNGESDSSFGSFRQCVSGLRSRRRKPFSSRTTICLASRPCFMAFNFDAALPVPVFGPVLLWEFRRLLSICSCVVMYINPSASVSIFSTVHNSIPQIWASARAFPAIDGFK